MKNEKRKRLYPALLLSLAALAGCSQTSATPVRSVPLSLSKDSFRLTCYSTPYHANVGNTPYGSNPEYNTEENWAAIKECGFNYAMPINDVSDEEILITLEQAAKAGLKTLIIDYLPDGLMYTINHAENKSYDETMAIIKKNEDKLLARYQKYATYSSFAGIQGKDEPAMSMNNAMAAASDWWYEHFPTYEFYVNLLPSYATYAQLMGAGAPDNYTYLDYVEQFVQKTNPAFLSYDDYPYIRSGFGATIRPNYLADLETFGLASKKYAIPFYCFQLVIQHLSYTGPESYREYAWQVNTALTYGCQGFQTFKYWAWLVDEDNAYNMGMGLVDQDGNKQPIYYAVQTMNQELQTLQKYFLSFSWEGTLPVGTSGGGAYSVLTSPLESLIGVNQVEASEDAIVGQFRDKKGNRAYMVTNYSSPYLNKSNTVSLHFKNAKKALVVKRGRAVVEDCSSGVLTMDLGSGEGYFVVPLI